MKPNRYERFMKWLFDKLPPRGVQAEFYLCKNCGRIRFSGEVHAEEQWKTSCKGPFGRSCGSTHVRAPKGKLPYMRLLWATLFQRKTAFYGLKDGLHSKYIGAPAASTPEELKARLQPEGDND